ncbi:unnamed protein product [Soboliphyme baturini]|uniref:Hydrocephalus-inducing protein homolog n=1 Tax=Soboliphyme baturini TaxID=241478 RepID=A0A183J883_9BILA|nr:unnamed protein product [Soboliphyme baturini]
MRSFSKVSIEAASEPSEAVSNHHCGKTGTSKKTRTKFENGEKPKKQRPSKAKAKKEKVSFQSQVAIDTDENKTLARPATLLTEGSMSAKNDEQANTTDVSRPKNKKHSKTKKARQGKELLPFSKNFSTPDRADYEEASGHTFFPETVCTPEPAAPAVESLFVSHQHPYNTSVEEAFSVNGLFPLQLWQTQVSKKKAGPVLSVVVRVCNKSNFTIKHIEMNILDSPYLKLESFTSSSSDDKCEALRPFDLEPDASVEKEVLFSVNDVVASQRLRCTAAYLYTVSKLD